jgi:hypothetical protein
MLRERSSIRRAAGFRERWVRSFPGPIRKLPVPKEIVPQLAFDRLFRNHRAPVVSTNPKNQAVSGIFAAR